MMRIPEIEAAHYRILTPSRWTGLLLKEISSRKIRSIRGGDTSFTERGKKC
ncbi:hypothetical protein CGLAMM_05765 [Acetobacteraceae bacterium EV16G]|uniref:Uncharacterized protein n=1 Tax=Sorlinia euscelidii TaxID=3081148 RepID=A0ABU7TZY4_9PROT